MIWGSFADTRDISDDETTWFLFGHAREKVGVLNWKYTDRCSQYGCLSSWAFLEICRPPSDIPRTTRPYYVMHKGAG